MNKKILLVLSIFVLAFSFVSCSNSDGESITFNELNFNLRSNSNAKVVDFYNIGGTLYIRTNSNYIYYLQRNYDDPENSFYLSQALNSGFTREVGGSIKEFVQRDNSLFSLSETGILVGTNSSRGIIPKDSPAVSYSGVLFNYFIELEADEIITDFAVTKVGTFDFIIFVLTSNHRVLSFGNNYDGKLLDGTKITPNCFIDITNNFPLNEAEQITAVGEGYFITNQNRILASDRYIGGTENIIFNFTEIIPLEENESITLVSMDYNYRSYVVLTSNNHIYINSRSTTSIVTINFDSEDIETTEVTEQTTEDDSPDYFNYDIYSFLNLNDGEEILKIEVEDGVIHISTDLGRLLSTRPGFFSEVPSASEVTIDELSYDIALYENEYIVKAFYLSNYGTYVLTSEGRVFRRIS